MELKALKSKLREGLAFIQKRLDKNVIIFLDDLDRCNPKYAIETLEAIKHFFGIKNIIFVLAVDKKQVENIVKTIYGVCEGTSDIGGYLKKFIDVEFNLPASTYKDFIGFQLQQIVECSAYFMQADRYYSYGEIIDGHSVDGKRYDGQLIDTVEKLVTALDLTPRAIEKLFMRVKLTIESLSKDDLLLIEIIFILNALYICDKKEFDAYVNAESFNYNIGKLRYTVDSVYPYWTDVLCKLNEKYQSYCRNRDMTFLSKEANVGKLIRLMQGNSIIDVDTYFKNYSAKIEFIGSMD